jgi:NAD-specific glutamate dehydrogenase
VTGGWDSVFLGVIAAATLIMAGIQVGAIVAALRVAKRLDRLANQVEHEVRPLIAQATDLAEQARRSMALANQQVERIDGMMAEITGRVTETVEILQRSVITPIREGSAVIAGLKAGFEALRSLRRTPARTGRVEDEDALFIG